MGHGATKERGVNVLVAKRRGEPTDMAPQIPRDTSSKIGKRAPTKETQENKNDNQKKIGQGPGAAGTEKTTGDRYKNWK